MILKRTIEMFDKMMFTIYSFTTAYHSFRGNGMGKLESIKGAYTVVSETKLNKSIAEFQNNMCKAMKEIANESKQ